LIVVTHPRKQFESHFSDNIWCGVVGSQVIRPFVLEELSTSGRYLRCMEVDLPVLLDVPLYIRQELCLQQGGAPPHFGRQLTQQFQDLDWATGPGLLATESICPHSFGLLSLGTYEVPGVRHEIERWGLGS
jgi:hypothetical protein